MTKRESERILIKSYPISSTMFVAVVAWCGRPKGDSLIMISRRKNKTRLPVPIMCCVKNVISIQSSTTRGSFIISYPTPSSKELFISKSVNHSRAPGTIPGLRGFLAEMFQVIGPGLARDQPGPYLWLPHSRELAIIPALIRGSRGSTWMSL